MNNETYFTACPEYVSNINGKTISMSLNVKILDVIKERHAVSIK